MKNLIIILVAICFYSCSSGLMCSDYRKIRHIPNEQKTLKYKYGSVKKAW